MNRRQAFMVEIAEAARKAARKPRRASAGQLSALETARAEDPLRGVRAARAAPRCTAKNREGRPCAAPAMRGCDRCAQHGGRLRAGPNHPGNLRWLLSGRAHRGLAMQEARREAREALAALSIQEARTLQAALPADASAALRAAGAVALKRSADDDGAAWRAWLRGHLS